MEQQDTLKAHYKFTDEEAQILKDLQPRMEELSDAFVDEFYDYIWGFGATAKFLKDKTIIAHHRTKIKEWFLNLFSGKYDNFYFVHLYKIGEVHVKIGLPTHYVNSAFTFVRTFALKSIEENFVDKAQHVKEIHAVEKIIDMNLDVLTSSYREEELSKFLSLSKVEKGILTVLGSLLVLWAAIELIHEEINHLQGKGFAIGAFIMLAMAALIRKVLIYSLSSDKSNELLVIGGVIVGLAVAYWLVGGQKKASSH